MEIKKIPPLSCPLCKSTRVFQYFNHRKGRAYLPTGVVYCYDCKCETNTKTGTTRVISVEEFEKYQMEQARERRLKQENRK
jgi:hypothetical protein